MQPDVACKLDGLFLPVKINPRFDLHAAARDAEINRKLRAEFEGRFDLAHAFGADADGEKSAAAKQRNREAERPLALGEIKSHFRWFRIEWQKKTRAERQVIKRKNANRERRDVDRITRADSARCD